MTGGLFNYMYLPDLVSDYFADLRQTTKNSLQMNTFNTSIHVCSLTGEVLFVILPIGASLVSNSF